MLEQEALKILGLKKGASQEEITKAGRTLRKQYHPDHNKDKGASIQYAAIEEATKTLGTGKNTLTTLEDIIKGGPTFKMGGHSAFAKTRDRKERNSQDTDEASKNDEVNEIQILETAIITNEDKTDKATSEWSFWDLPVISHFFGNSHTNTPEWSFWDLPVISHLFGNSQTNIEEV